MRKNFRACYQKKVFIEYCEMLVGFIMEPILEFFKSSVGNLNAKNALNLSTSHQPNILLPNQEFSQENKFV